MAKLVVLLLMLIQQCYGIIYKLNEAEFNRMPPMFEMDNYAQCLNDPEGIYCSVEFTLVSERKSELLTMIQEYSEYSLKHFNHTKPLYGVCLTRRCKQYYRQHKSADLKLVLEMCLNESLWNEYQLKSKVHDIQCTKSNEKMDIDDGDFIVAKLMYIILFINLVASIYDYFFIRGTLRTGNSYLMNFSLLRNSLKLVDTSDRSDERQNCFKSLDAIRSVLMVLSIIGHSLHPVIVLSQNVHYMETAAYESPIFKILYNGFIVVQVFFLISAFLLSHNLQMSLEEKELKGRDILERIFTRWWRLTPPYAVWLALTASWNRFAGSGPFWKVYVTREAIDCRRSWWKHVMYINNYFMDGTCMPHSWHLAADFQLHILGLIVFIMCKGTVRRLVLMILFIIGLIAPGLKVLYYQDIDATVLAKYESVRRLLTDALGFIHAPAQNNLTSFIIGLSMGLFVYHLQRNKFEISKYKKYQLIYYLLPFFVLLTVMASDTQYTEAPLSVYSRAMIASILRPAPAVWMAAIIFGAIFKYEDTYRGFLEAPVWKVLYRISYCAFIVHQAVFRMIAGSSLLVQSNHLYLAQVTLGNVFISYIMGSILWLLVEAPFSGLVDTMRSRNQQKRKMI
ncbi:O-acyltransferase like protein-like isoform X2 [Leptidea sinapis]|nr:O-acyltransferase like protein-like isoform X2 [Leptidea sinapis]